MYKQLLAVLCLVLLSSCKNSINAEGPLYKVLEQKDAIEIRQYEKSIIAEVTTNGDRDKAANNAFYILFDYISGANIDMTAPVTQQKKSVKIPMTAPVTQKQQDSESWKVAFYMPNNYTLKTLPKPKDERIKIIEQKPRKIAAVRFSGMWTDSNYEEHKKELMDFIEANKFKTKGELTYAYYNQPLTPWFMRRNEVMVEIK